MHAIYDVLIAAGGDGALNEVVNGIAEKPNRPKLVLFLWVLLMTLQRALHIPNDIMGALDVIIQGHSTKVDIGKMNNRYFINLAAGGKNPRSLYEYE
ncbi:diacylglycerol kinase family protein [Staphylococcus aureus]